LFRIFIVGFVAFIPLDAITPGMHRYTWTAVVGMLGMFANLFEDPSHVVWPGPYWYFSITLQLYIFYRLVLYRWRHWGLVVGMIVLCWLWQLSCQDDAVLLERLRYNLIGGVLPFGLGLLAARIPTIIPTLGTKHSHVGNKIFPNWEYIIALLLAVALIVALSSNFQGWLWVPAFIVVGTIALVKVMPEWMLSYSVWLGGISSAIFVRYFRGLVARCTESMLTTNTTIIPNSMMTNMTMEMTMPHANMVNIGTTIAIDHPVWLSWA
jgi:hypothetical protein